MMNSIPAGVAGHDRRGLRRERRARRVRRRRSSRSRARRDEPLDRHRRHDDARRQPEPLERDRPDDAGRRSRSRRRSTGSASTPPTSRRARTWPSRCASTRRTRGSGSGSSARRCRTRRSASSPRACASSPGCPADEDVMRLVVPLRRPQRDPPLPDRRPVERPARACGGWPRMAREEGVEEVVIGLTYSVSPVHTHAYYAERAAALADCAEMDRLYLKDPGGLLTPDAVRELAPHFLARRRRAHGRAAQPLHDRARAVRLHGGAAGRLPGAAHGRRAARARHVEPGRRDDAPRPRGRGLLAPARPRRARGGRRSTSASSRARRGCRSAQPQEFDATYYHHQLAGRDGLDDAADARGAAPARAVRRRARGGRPRARRDGLPDHRHAGLAARRHAGGAERDRRRALVERLRRDRPLLPRPLRRAGRARRPGRRRARALAAARRGAARSSSRSTSRARASASARGSPTRSCCCG